MKKIFFKEIFLTFIFTFTLFIGFSNVKADTAGYISDYYSVSNSYSNNLSIYEDYSSIITNLKNYYSSNYSSQYPYYLIYPIYSSGSLSQIDFYMFPSDNLIAFNDRSNNNRTTFNALYDNYSTEYPLMNYNLSSNIYEYNNSIRYQEGISFSRLPYDTNLTLSDSSFCPSLIEDYCYDSVSIASYSDLTLDISIPQIDISSGNIVPSFISITNGDISSGFTQVNVSDYEYIILSLKDYNTTPFNTTIYSQGSFCLTPVYDYGMKPKSDYFNGYKTQSCSENYSSLTPVGIYIIQSDITYHSIYYIKALEGQTNIIQVPTSIFDITYITSANKDNPSVVINGRSYPTIPFNDLTDTANKSTDEGFISGQVCAIGDINCQAEANGFDISDLFSKPLQLLETIWDSISTVFTLISSFISILPPTLQAFLYVSFMLIVVLGILRYIL